MIKMIKIKKINPNSGQWVALIYITFFLFALLVALIFDQPKRPILYFGSLYIGPIVFLIMGLMYSRLMAVIHFLVLVITSAFVYINFNDVMSLYKQITFNWSLMLMLLFIIFFILHSLPKNTKSKSINLNGNLS